MAKIVFKFFEANVEEDSEGKPAAFALLIVEEVSCQRLEGFKC